MKIAHITATFPPYWGGTGTVCYFNARELARLGHDVHVFTAASDNNPLIETRDGFIIHRLRSIIRIGNAPLIPALFRVKGFDIIHLHYPFIFGAEILFLVSKFKHIPLVLTHHNDLIGDGSRRFLFNIYFTLSSRLIFNQVSKFVVVSKDYAEYCHLTPLYKKHKDDIVEVPNGVDTKQFTPSANGKLARQEHGIREEDRIILFVGALDRAHHFKGVGNLLKSFSLIQDRRTILIIVGDGDQKKKWISLANDLDVSRTTYFVGAIPNDQLPPYYVTADIVVLPSSPPESFGMVLLEAMACGRPVITSNIPGVRTVVIDGVDGYLVKPGDINDLTLKLNQMLELSPENRRRIGAAGRSKVEQKYTWELAGQRLEEIYRQVIS